MTTTSRSDRTPKAQRHVATFSAKLALVAAGLLATLSVGASDLGKASLDGFCGEDDDPSKAPSIVSAAPPGKAPSPLSCSE